VTGIFETGHYLHDSEFLLVPIYVGQELYGLDDALHGVTVRTDDPYGAERVKQAIQQFLEPPQYAQTWIDMNHQYFEAVRLERTVMFFLLFFIDVAHRDFPARSLSIFVHSCGSHPARRRDRLYQRLSHLFICSPDPCLFRCAPRSGQSPALRVKNANQLLVRSSRQLASFTATI